jgi:tetratricopeptide (TPR) repeat protein/AAA+ ATPase superfamily predicted ATPase
MPRYLVLIALIAAVLLAAGSPVLAETWYEHYAAAEKALADGEWRLAVEQLNTALEKKGDSGVRVRTYGMKFTAYFPYLKLGIAYYELGQLDAALQAFETEERLGAIAGSEKAVQDLARYRELTTDARQAAQAAEAARIEGIVNRSMGRAKEFENEGRLEEAIGELGTAVAVSPDQPDALAMLSRLRAALARRQEEADTAQRTATLVEQGRAHLAAGDLAEAASVLRQALSLTDSEEVRGLLAEAQGGLLEELESLQVARRAQTVTEALSAVSKLEAAGRFSEALDRLQSVLVLDPGNQEAITLEERLLEARESTVRNAQRRKTIDDLLASVDTALASGDVGSAMTTANRILGLDPSNESALAALASAYRILNGQLLGESPRLNVPPAFSFVDSRQERDDGTLTQIVRRSDFVLSGFVIDDSPVEIDFFDSEGDAIDGSQRSRQLGELSITEFQISRRLAMGLNRLRLVARDTRGLSSSSEYLVVYERPFIRSPWFTGLVAGLLILVLGGVIAQRARRQRRLRGRRFNPYMAGSPVLDARLFFGREHLLDRILQTLHNNSLLLHGERRIGKTSLQHQLKRRLEELQDPAFVFYPVYIDLQGTPEEKFFSTLAEEIFEELQPALEGLEPASSLAGEYGYREFIKDLRQVLKRLRDHDERQARLVLLIDEVDELNSYDSRVNQKLRSLFMKSFAENLVAVVSGVAIKREWDREGSPWYNFFEEIDVGPIDPEDARELVERPVHGVVRLEEEAVDRILEVTGCRPYRIQKLCMNLVNRMYEEGGSRITVADVDAVGSPSETVTS